MYFNIIIFITLFIVVYLFYYLFVIRSKKAMDKMMDGKEMTLLKRNYHLDMDKINKHKIAHLIALTNSFIIAFTTVIVCLLNEWISNFYLWLVACLFMSLLILFPLIIILYHFIGSHFSKKQKEM